MELGAFSGAVFLQFFSLYDIFYQWESSGIFDLLLPALLIFALIFGILTTTNVLGSNKGVSVLIAGVIAVMAIRAPIVRDFFSVIFPSLGIGLAILLVVVILVGLFVAKGQNLGIFLNIVFWGGLSIGIIIVLVVLNNFNWFGSFWWQNNWVSILVGVIIVGIIIAFLVDKDEDKDGRAKRKNAREGSITIPFDKFRD